MVIAMHPVFWMFCCIQDTHFSFKLTTCLQSCDNKQVKRIIEKSNVAIIVKLWQMFLCLSHFFVERSLLPLSYHRKLIYNRKHGKGTVLNNSSTITGLISTDSQTSSTYRNIPKGNYICLRIVSQGRNHPGTEQPQLQLEWLLCNLGSEPCLTEWTQVYSSLTGSLQEAEVTQAKSHPA